MKTRRNIAPLGRATRTVVCLGIAATCSMALWLSAGSALASPEQDPVVVGDASALEAGVEVRGGANAPFVLLETVEPVAVGDGVRTDTTGFAEIAYFDGSRTRLDVDTEFEVVELVNDAGVSSTRTSMGVGRTWYRVESLGEGEFTVETSQATATVRGTAFVIACAAVETCTYLVFEGIIELTLADGSVVEVVGPAEVEVVGGVAGPVTPVTLDRLLSDPWLLANANLDIAAGFADLVAILGPSEVTTTEPSTTSTITADTSTTTESTTSTSEPSTSTMEPSTSTTTDPATTPPTSTTSTSSTTTTSPTTTTPTTPTTPPTEVAICHWVADDEGDTGNGYDYLVVDTEVADNHQLDHGDLDLIPAPNPECSSDEEVAICHQVEGRGNTGNGYNYLVVGESAAEAHTNQHVGDFIPDPLNEECVTDQAEIIRTSVPPSTTTTTEPVVAAPTAARAVAAAAPAAAAAQVAAAVVIAQALTPSEPVPPSTLAPEPSTSVETTEPSTSVATETTETTETTMFAGVPIEQSSAAEAIAPEPDDPPTD
jgi:FecR protein